MSDPLEFLSGQSGQAEDLTPQNDPAPADRPRGEHGHFAPLTPPEPTPPAATPAAPPEAVQPTAEPGHVPISAMLDEREKRQAATARADTLERQMAEMRAQAAPPPPLEPDEARRLDLFIVRRDLSRDLAAGKYGDETVKTIEAWAADRCNHDQAFNQQILNARNPFEAVKAAYDRNQIITKVTPDRLAAFEAWEAAQAAGQGAAPALAPNPTPPAAAPRAPIPRSLANAPGNGGAGGESIPVGPGAAFAAVIRR